MTQTLQWKSWCKISIQITPQNMLNISGRRSVKLLRIPSKIIPVAGYSSSKRWKHKHVQIILKDSNFTWSPFLNISLGSLFPIILCWLLFFPQDLKTTKPVQHLLPLLVTTTVWTPCGSTLICLALEGRREKYQEREIAIFISIRTILRGCNLS